MQPTTLTYLLAHSKSAEPAIIDEAAAVTISYRAVADQVGRMAEGLRGAGLRPGDAVALFLPNGLEFFVMCLAVARARLIAAPLSPASKANELRAFLSDVEARAVVAGRPG